MSDDEKQKKILFNWQKIKNSIPPISKSNRWLLVFLLILLLIGANYYWPTKKNKLFDFSRVGTTVDHINLQRADTIYQLVKNNNQWFIANKDNQPANQEAIDQLLATVATMNFDQPFSQNPDKQKSFQVDESGWQLSLLSGEQKQLGLIVGKYGPSWPSSYVRLENSNDVYLVNSPLTQIIEQSDWRDLTIIKATEGQIQRVEWAGKMIIEKKDNKWSFTTPANIIIDENKLQPVFTSLANFLALDISAEKKESLSAKPKILILKITTPEGLKELNFWSKDQDQYWVTRSDSDIVYIISKGLYVNIDQEIKNLKK
ncbi:MAG: hypothetical protein COX77_03680 [Candidatus Komeilibacteria bacterium CG_4_10_14_0_2_um_filter_37_10]|uniref:DUF4340 domain-containing protein n=1 Tax=Candidatus Komeilibacteria bacterium CG_4_10_14_0_2_um_filter_37_10 TaxID=1974470 RepID=A0A2M7VE02_9BACT|nr:MAG: hypothetical protein COX77_03680 [Candidatus Komeilibacteria bacterium CG_4_10_14_0_2_um_filter_37_10]PJA94242.1 MAG: hypothetical protein CO133_00265 [Candidatus Komeilibacteria bacterium CG_4_9_14_3_um_filter_37_5]